MKAIYKYIIAATLCLLCSISATAQHQVTVKDIPVGFGLQLKNMHLWRGLQITNEAMAGVDLNVSTRNKDFTFGLWGGAGFTGKFKEFDYYVSYQKSGFKVAVWDIYNFSKGAAYNNTNLFNYNARETGHFVDVSVGYTFKGKYPLNINWATVVFGRDRGMDNDKNLYSTYVSASCPVLTINDIQFDLGMAGAFALSKEKGNKANFYGRNAGIVNVNLVAAKSFQIGSYTLPVSITGMWNPVNKEGNLQIALNVL